MAYFERYFWRDDRPPRATGKNSERHALCQGLRRNLDAGATIYEGDDFAETQSKLGERSCQEHLFLCRKTGCGSSQVEIPRIRPILPIHPRSPTIKVR